MKKIIGLTFLLSACGAGIGTGNGVYSGKLVDVSWEGLFFKSCEIRQQTGYIAGPNGGGSEERASSYDKALCDQLAGMVGKDVKIRYSERFFSGPSLGTGYLIESIE
jgi:hypothetical protein